MEPRELKVDQATLTSSANTLQGSSIQLWTLAFSNWVYMLLTRAGTGVGVGASRACSLGATIGGGEGKMTK